MHYLVGLNVLGCSAAELVQQTQCPLPCVLFFNFSNLIVNKVRSSPYASTCTLVCVSSTECGTRDQLCPFLVYSLL